MSGPTTPPAAPVDAREPRTDVLDTLQAGRLAIRGSALRTLGYAASVLLSLITVPLLVRHLGVTQYGEYIVVMSVIAVAGGLTEGGLTAIGVREYVVQRGASRDALMRNLLGLRLVLTVCGVLGAAGFALAAGYSRTLILGTLLAGLGFLLLSTQNLLTAPLFGTLSYGWITAVDLVRQAVTVPFVLTLILVGSGLLPFFLTSVAAGVLTLALTVRLVRTRMPMRPSADAGEWRRLLLDTLPYAAATAVYAAYFRVAIIAMSLLASKLETGYFATSFRILEIFIGVPVLLVGAIFPILARAATDDYERLRHSVDRVLEVALIVGVWFVLVIELGAQMMIDLVAGDQAQPSVDVLRIQGPAILFTFLAMATGFPLLSLRRHGALLASNVLALFVGATLVILLVPPFEANGAAVATLGAEVVLGLSQAFFLFQRRSGLRPSFAFLPALALATGLAVSVSLVPDVPDAARLALATVVYVGVLALLGRIPPEIRRALLGWRAESGADTNVDR